MRPQLNTAPSFIMELKDLTVSDGYQVHLECKVTGYPRPQIKWYVDGMELSSSEDFQITYQEDGYISLFINDALPEDEGEYLVEAYNSAGRCSTAAYLTVIHSVGTSPEPVQGQYAQQKTREHLVQQSMKKNGNRRRNGKTEACFYGRSSNTSSTSSTKIYQGIGNERRL